MLDSILRENFSSVHDHISAVPRVSLACLPTPLAEARQLSKMLGGPRIFIKRDDLTGIGLGGNKTRNLEFRLARTVAEQADVVLVGLDLQSNSARQTVGCCNKLGMRTVLVLVGERPDPVQGNLLIDYLLGADVHFVPDAVAQRAMLDELAKRYRRDGHSPHILNDNPMFDVASALAYIECVMEIMEDMQNHDCMPTHLYMSSSGKGQAGLILAQKLFKLPFAVHGVTATREFDVPERTAEIANRTAREVGFDVTVRAEEVINFDQYVGEAYGIPSGPGNEAVKMMARAEGVIIDPVYTGKCVAGLVDHVRKGMLTSEHVVVFIHTGGGPAVFTHSHLWL